MAITAADRMIKPSAGVLTASVRFHGQVIEAIDLKLERPLQVLAGLHGKRPADCLRLLPLLFPLCGTAHASAALQAIEAAASVVPEPVHALARSALAMAVRLAAEVWRTCIDWALLTQTGSAEAGRAGAASGSADRAGDLP